MLGTDHNRSPLTQHQEENFLTPALMRYRADILSTTYITGVSGAGKTHCILAFLEHLGLVPFSFGRYWEERKNGGEPSRQRGTYIAATVVRRAACVLTLRGVLARTIHQVAYSPILNRTDAEIKELAILNTRLEALERKIAERPGARANDAEAEMMERLRRAIEELSAPSFGFSPSILDLTDVLVIDEASMVPDWMHKDLLTTRPYKLFVGDHAQNSAFDSACWFEPSIMDGRLTQPMRQQGHSGIFGAAERLRGGNELFPKRAAYGRDGMTVHPFAHHARWLQQNLDVVEQSLIVVDTNWLRNQINCLIRRLRGHLDWCPVAGDRIMVTKNAGGFSNGEILIVDHVHGYDAAINAVLVDAKRHGERVVIERLALNVRNLAAPYRTSPRAHRDWKDERSRRGITVLPCEYGFAITCHKAQGSEWQHVVVIVSDWGGGSDNETRRKWLYTAITRGSAKCDLFFFGIGEGRDLDHYWKPSIARRPIALRPASPSNLPSLGEELM